VRAVIIALLLATLANAAEGRTPGAGPLTSPGGSFRIIQQFDRSWHATLHFTKADLPSIVFAEDYGGPAQFFVSPDDEWLLQIQKSGYYPAVLYHIERNGRIWRMEDPLSAATFKYLEQSEGLSTAHLGRARFDFVGWNFPPGLLRFRIRASSAQYGQGIIERSLNYDLQKHTFHATKP
jgi:hypothetical protein